MGFFDFIADESRREQEKKDPSFSFDWLKANNKDPIKPKRPKHLYKDLESYTNDEEADEDGFLDDELP